MRRLCEAPWGGVPTGDEAEQAQAAVRAMMDADIVAVLREAAEVATPSSWA